MRILGWLVVGAIGGVGACSPDDPSPVAPPAAPAPAAVGQPSSGGSPPPTVPPPAGPVVFVDDFKALPPLIGATKDNSSVKDGVLSVRGPEKGSTNVVYEKRLPAEIDVTVEVRLQGAAGETRGAAGLLFWAVNESDFHAVGIRQNGMVEPWRYASPRWHRPAPARRVEAAHVDPAAWTTLRVLAVGSRITVFANGVEIVSFHARWPESGSQLGFYAETEKTAGTAEFRALRVSKPAAPPVKDALLALEDDFAFGDPSWVPSSPGRLSFGGGVARIEPESERALFAYQDSVILENMEASVRVRFSRDAAPGDQAFFVFCAASLEDYRIFQLGQDGTVSVNIRKDGAWTSVEDVDPVPPAAKFDPHAWTELKVRKSAGDAWGWVNGQKVFHFSGAVPRGKTSMGFGAGTGKTVHAVEFSSFVLHGLAPEKSLREQFDDEDDE